MQLSVLCAEYNLKSVRRMALRTLANILQWLAPAENVDAINNLFDYAFNTIQSTGGPPMNCPSCVFYTRVLSTECRQVILRLCVPLVENTHYVILHWSTCLLTSETSILHWSICLLTSETSILHCGLLVC